MTIALELPEIETVRRDLDRDLAGRKVKSAEAASMAVLEGYRNRKQFTGQLEGRKVASVRRAGLHLCVELDDQYLVIRLGPGALLRRQANKEAVEPRTEVTITFTQGGQLRLVDPKGDSQVRLVGADAIFDELPELDRLGLDPIGEPISWTDFARRVLSRSTPLKDLLCDESFIVGIGDVYSDEILFSSGLRHDRSSDSLSSQEVRRLYRAVVEIIHDAVKYRGTSLEERPFVDVFGSPGIYQDHLAVFGRTGDLSPRSRLPIQRAKYKNGWTYYCDTQV
ncbi:MAG: DNA-formamidopyrimidine glycosylase family protein [Acidimicrobiales bacterium]|nr:DNA-formamidopyrimidine glycosylase family protein [Acidimicrobiales bacterium]